MNKIIIKNSKQLLLLLIILSLINLTGCSRKVGIGSKNLFKSYYGQEASKIEKIAPEYLLLGDTDEGFALVDEKAGFSLILSVKNNYVDQIIVVYQKSSDNKKQAEIMLDPPNDATCHEIDGGSWGKGLMQYICYKRNK